MTAKAPTPMPENVQRPKAPSAPPKPDKPVCHWACTGCDICGSKGHANSWF